MGLRLFRRRRERIPPPRSTLRVQSGEWWAADGYWTAPLDERWRPHDGNTDLLHARLEPFVAYLTDRALPIYHSGGVMTSVSDGDTLTDVPIPPRASPNGDGSALFVAHDQRRAWLVDGTTYSSGALWEADRVVEAELDDDGLDVPAGGLVLSREIATGRLRHTVGIVGDLGLPRGTRIRLDPTFHVEQSRAPHATRTVLTALQTHGGVLLGGSAGPVAVVCERAAGPVSDDVGRIYREAGWYYDPQPLDIPGEHLSVITAKRRRR